MNPNVDYIAQYKSISNILKKRFLKKPNIAEASQQYASLANTFANEECFNYAGVTLISKANCEASLNCFEAEASAYVEAARNFTLQRLRDSFLCPSYGENIMSAEHCYIKAINIYLMNDCKPLAASISSELANTFMKLKNYSKAIIHFRQTSKLQYSNPLSCLNSISQMGICLIQNREYEKALDVYTEMYFVVLERGLRHQSGARRGDFLQVYKQHECDAEVSIVLLLLYLRPKSSHMKAEHSAIIYKYYWTSSEKSCLSDILCMLLKSIVMAYDSRDKTTLESLQSNITPHLTLHQNTLMSLIISKEN